MADVNREAMAFLLARRSHSPKTLSGPAPSRAELEPILTAGLRVPDHGAIEPWRVVVYEKPALERLGAALPTYGQAAGIDPEKITKSGQVFSDSPLMVAVVLSPVDHKVPEWEQVLSAGAACLGIVNAALASGWGAGWVTGWACEDRSFVEKELGLAPKESIAGFIHIGTKTITPQERLRPNLAKSVDWVAS